MKKILFYVALAIVMLCCSCGGNLKDEIDKALQSREIEENLQQELKIMQSPQMYTYADLGNDISLLQKRHGDMIQVINVCKTYDDRNVYDVVIGDLKSENHILIMGAMHAREYITTQVVMRQLCDYIEKINNNDSEILALSQNTALHFVPMVNPDGVTICQKGIDGLKTQKVRDSVLNICESTGFYDYTQWKANAQGIDINRNFDADWDAYVGAQVPSSERYKGEYPHCSPEAAGLVELTRNYGFKRTISYHAKGSLIYWYFKQTGSLLEETQSFAHAISSATGYYLEGDYTKVDAAGYKDWALCKMNIPSITIEVGGEAPLLPVPAEYFDNIWEENKNVIRETLRELKR